MLEGHEAVVGDGHAMGVAGEIAEHMMRTAERWLGVDDPVLTEQWTQEGAEGPFVFQRLEIRRKRVGVAGIGVLDLRRTCRGRRD